MGSKSRFKNSPVLENLENKLTEALNKITNLEKSLTVAFERIRKLESQIKNQDLAQEKLKEKAEKPYCESVIGFRIAQKVTTNKHKGKIHRYHKWYAVRYKDGKQQWVYLGDIENTKSEIDKTKIESYLQKKEKCSSLS